MASTTQRDPAALQHMPAAVADIVADPAALAELVDDAVVWASQHGLVRTLLRHCTFHLGYLLPVVLS
jgi:hypothetical protein